MKFQPNVQQIIKAITSAKISPSAKEMSAVLVESWMDDYSESDLQYRTVAVESPYYFWIQPKTVIIGVMDRHARDKEGIFGCEWKSAKEPQQNKDGSDSAWWNEEVWLEGISQGTQLSIYGLALRQGTFIVGKTIWRPQVQNPRIIVRAAVKANPPRFWPTNAEDGVFQFPNEYLDKVVAPALIVKAEQIRAARKSKLIPWALPGNHCYNRFRKECPYHSICLSHEHPELERRELFDYNDPGSAALVAAGITNAKSVEDSELVIFSASSYDTSQQCVERYRILVDGHGPKEQDQNLDIGTGLHAGLAALYRQQKAHWDLTVKKK